MDTQHQGASLQSDLRRVVQDQRLDGKDGTLILDTGAVTNVTDWVINVVVTRSGESSWTARFHVPDEVSFSALLAAHRVSGQFLNGEKVKFLGALIGVQREGETLYCIAQGAGNLQIEAG
jgi:hypothetical protein